MEVSGQLHDPAALPPGKETLLPIGWVGPIGQIKIETFNEFTV
jgi:hypothetical protein